MYRSHPESVDSILVAVLPTGTPGDPFPTCLTHKKHHRLAELLGTVFTGRYSREWPAENDGGA